MIVVFSYNASFSLYKISEDFNECMIEYYADINVILLEDEDEDGDEGNYNDYEDGTDTWIDRCNKSFRKWLC